LRDEKNLPANQAQAEKDARLPGADEDRRGAAHAQEKTPEGTQAAGGLRDRRRRRRETFPPSARLRKRREFLAVYEHGVRVPGALLVLFVAPRPEGGARLGITTTRRVGSAVVRNRLRRLVRELFRRHRHRMGSWDIVVNVRAAARGATYREMEADWRRLLRRVDRRVGRGGSHR